MSELIYPVFLECTHLTDDIYWKNIFENMAFGIAPYNTFFRKNHLVSNQKGKEFNYKIEIDKGSEYVFEKIYNLLHDKLGLMSNIQIKNEETNFENQNRKKKMVSSLIDEYCNRMKNEYHLDTNTIKRLQRHVQFNMMLKTSMLNKIIYNEDGSINKIDGIEYSHGNVGIYHFCPDKTQYDYLVEEELMLNYWNKYI